MAERWRGKWALVTGASAGIGVALARQLAADGTNLVLTARRRDRLESLAKELRSSNGVQVEVVSADLSRPEAPGEIFAFTSGRGIEIDLLINNAGFGHYGWFHASSLEPQMGMVQVNCAAVVHLTHLYLPGHGAAPPRRYFNSGLDCFISSSSGHRRLCGEQSLRSALRRGTR